MIPDQLPLRQAGVAGVAGDSHAPAAATAAVLTYAAAGAEVQNVIGDIHWSYSEAPTGGALTIEDGAGTTIFVITITAAGPGSALFPHGKKGSVNTAMVVTLASGGGTCVGKVNATHWTE